MPKPIDAVTFRRLQKKTGNRPVLIAGINWGLGTEWYGSRTITLGRIHCKGEIIQGGSISAERREDNMGTAANMTLILDDDSGILKTRMDLTPIERTPCSVFLAFEGMTDRNMVPLIV